MASWPVVPWESAELGLSAVSTFGLPWRPEDGAAGLVGHQLEPIPAGVAAEPFGRLEPDRVAGAVVITEAVNGRREDLDLSAGGAERRPSGVAPESGQQHLAGVGHRDLQRFARP